MSYSMPTLPQAQTLEPQTVYLVASGDSRDAANKTCWAAQRDMEAKLEVALTHLGWKLKRAHDYDPILEHGFIWNQRMGMNVFSKIPKNAPLIVAEAVWQFSHHVLAGLRDHQGSILTVANWSGQWPGLVGLLNLGGGLTKMGVPFSSLWSKDFTDAFFTGGLIQFLETGQVVHDLSHVRRLEVAKLPQSERELGIALAQQLKLEKAIIGVFDEGCMGMYNAIIDDEMLNPCGIYKERLSQSALVAEMQTVSNLEAQNARDWLDAQGMKFNTGTNPDTELTDAQILEQLKMYVAAIRIAHDFSCDAIGIQYQLGLKDMTPASDLVEGLLNNVSRPPVKSRDGQKKLYAGKALPHFNEVDEGAAVDALVTNRVWNAMGFDPATTLHDVRWGEEFNGQYVWVFLISGAAPPSHFIGGYSGSSSDRQPAMYFGKGGGTLKGISKPGELVWSRVFVMDGSLHCDIGRASVVELPETETKRRWELTTPEWPIMHAVLHGVSRDQLMARHKANHIQVAYCPTPEDADKALAAKAAMLEGMGITVHLCGTVGVG
jgi:L-fucose isomerase, C-terminal domain